MNPVKIFAFSQNGQENARKIAAEYQKRNYTAEVVRSSDWQEEVKVHFKTGNILIFVGAIGIAVRAIAKLIQSKTTDPAVLVVDECLHHVIPILSGHIGGANENACELSRWISAVPVITTATDLNEVFAVDVFAVKNRCHIMNPEKIKMISSALLAGENVGFAAAYPVVGEIPKGVRAEEGLEKGFVVQTQRPQKRYKETLWLYPKCFHVGIGARKNVSFESLHDFFLKTLEEFGIPIHGVASLASIDLKKDEPAILKLADTYGYPFFTYGKDALNKYSKLFQTSDFVRQQVGVGNVCESAAYLASQCGKVMAPKRAKNGVTLAIAQESWQVSFDFKNKEA